MEIRMTPDALRAKAGAVRDYKAQHDALTKSVTSLVNGLEQTWQGSAQKSFLTKFESMRSIFAELSEMLDGYAQDLDQAADEMQQTDQNTAGRHG